VSALLDSVLPCPTPEAMQAPRPFFLSALQVEGMDDMAGIRLEFWRTSQGVDVVAIDQQRNVRQVGVIWETA